MRYWILFILLMFLLINLDEFPDTQFWVNGLIYSLFFILPVWVIVWLVAWLKRRYSSHHWPASVSRFMIKDM
jgi:hypothetical protein